MERRVEMGWLLDFYGPLLTENRQRILRLYCEEDLSLAEIAEQAGISRQGVYDMVNRAHAQLNEYEEKLGLLKRYRQMQRELEACREYLTRIVPEDGSAIALDAAKEALERIEWIER